jgi:fibronectin type 3 domain-containing protein
VVLGATLFGSLDAMVHIYRGKGSREISLLAKGVTKSRYRDLVVTAGTSYSYQVSAIGSSGSESRRSWIFTITIV